MASRRVAKATVGSDGTRYRSVFECTVAEVIREAGTDPCYEMMTFPYRLSYLVDFAPYRSDGVAVFFEAKGYFPAEDRAKVLALLRSNPKLRDRFYLIFQRPTMKVTKTLTAAHWANKHGILWGGVDSIQAFLR